MGMDSVGQELRQGWTGQLGCVLWCLGSAGKTLKGLRIT